MKKSFLLIAISVLATSAKAQQPWAIGGNNGLQVFQPNNNFLGSQTANNSSVKFGVNGSQDIFIDNLNVAPQILPNSTGGVPEGGHWIGLGRVFAPSLGTGANINLSPKAHLHIHGGNTSTNPNFTSGVRPWFQTGVLSTEESNGMYVGLKRLGSNSSFAVINWADDAFGTANIDFLSFNFTSGELTSYN